MRDNSLPAININLTAGLYNLQILNLAGNPIATIQAESFKDNRNLTELLLFWDRLTVIQSLSNEINSELLCGSLKCVTFTWYMFIINCRGLIFFLSFFSSFLFSMP